METRKGREGPFLLLSEEVLVCHIWLPERVGPETAGSTSPGEPIRQIKGLAVEEAAMIASGFRRCDIALCLSSIMVTSFPSWPPFYREWLSMIAVRCRRY